MSEAAARRRPQLGRGLSALLGETDQGPAPAAEAGSIQSLPIERLVPNPKQPRRRFTDVELAELARSIRERGIVQPLLVRPHPDGADGSFEIVAGERRWRAAQQAQLHEVPVVIQALDDGEALQISIIENVQRQDLSVLEEAQAYRRLIDQFQHTQESVAGIVGKSRSHIANSLRLLNLPDSVQQLLEDNQLTAGHARALLALDDPAAAAEEVIRRNLTVRQTEALSQKRSGAAGAASAPAASPSPGTRPDPTAVGPDSQSWNPPGGGYGPRAPGSGADPFDYPTDIGPNTTRRRPLADADALALADDLSDQLGMKVKLAMRSGGRGTLTVDFLNLEQLDYLVGRLSPPIGLGE
jgi:ParB family chromosome partitioning protein